MIDLLIVKAPVGPVQQHYESRLAHVAVRRFSTTRSKPTTTYIDSPLTGAQMEVRYSIERPFDRPTAYIEISIPVASAIMGQNYVHAGVDSIRWEVTCAAFLVRLVLITLGFNTAEVEQFMRLTEVQLCELTWHTSTASLKARGSLQRRTADYFEALGAIKSRHDVAIANVDYRRRNGLPGLLVTLKNGVEFRQYGKFDQALLRSKRGKQGYAVSAEMMANREMLVESIERHVRNEVRLSAEFLKELGLLHPRTWTPDAMLGAIDSTWEMLGLAPSAERTNSRKGHNSALSPEAQRTLSAHLEGNRNLMEELSPSAFTRHRKAIKESTGIEIDTRGGACGVNPTSLGHQLRYARRWEPKDHFRRLVLCEETGSAKVLDLQRGIAFIVDGEVPAIDCAAELDEWLKRWKNFAQRERLCQAVGGENGESDDSEDK